MLNRPSDLLRIALFAALGVQSSACDTDTGIDDTGADDTGDTGDTDTDSGDTTDTVDTDTGDTGDTSDTGDTGDVCGDAPNAETTWATDHALSYGDWTVCLTIPYTDAGCTTSADLATRVDDIMSPDCVYDSGDTATFPGPTNPPCDDHMVAFDHITCGPASGPASACCFEVFLNQMAIGRPLVVDQESRTALPTRRAGWTDGNVALDVPADLLDRVRDAWLDIARAEHASVASFALVVLDLVTHGAPADLVADATRAQADEIRHATAAFAVASGLDGQAWGPAPLDLSGLALRFDIEQVLVAAIIEGCIGETVAAHEAAVASTCAADPALRALLASIADDEGRHAALAWRIVRWILAARPELTDRARRTFDDATAAVRARPADTRPDLSAWGILTGPRRTRAATEALDRVIAPCRAALAV